MHELSLAGAVLSLRLLVPAVPAVEPCPLSSGCERSARALGGSVVLWHTMAVPVVLRGWSGAGSCWCCLPGVQPSCPEQSSPSSSPCSTAEAGCELPERARHRWRMSRAVPGKSGFALTSHCLPAHSLGGCVPAFSLTPRAPLCPLDLGAFLGLCQGCSCWVPPLRATATRVFVAQSTITKLLLPSCVPPHL